MYKSFQRDNFLQVTYLFNPETTLFRGFCFTVKMSDPEVVAGTYQALLILIVIDIYVFMQRFLLVAIN